MTLKDAILKTMESISENIEFDQVVNKLVDKEILTQNEVSRLEVIEEKDKQTELLMILLDKEDSYHPLILEILQTFKTPSAENSRRVDKAITQAIGGAGESGSRELVKSERRILSSAELSDDWELKNFLFELSKEINTSELEDMKDLMRGETGFRENVMAKIERPMTFFQQLTRTGRVNAHNLLFLQALVRRIGRKDLNEKVRQFCLQSNKAPIHFFTPSEQPENGYKDVRHHVEGNIEDLSHTKKERLRADIAMALCVPLDFVYIKGIEPSDSILITFMVPEEDVKSFIQIYVKEGPSTFHMSVYIEIKDEELWFSEKPPNSANNQPNSANNQPNSANDQPNSANHPTQTFQSELKHLLERKLILEKQLEDRDEKLMILQEKLDEKEEETTLDRYDPDEAKDDSFAQGQSKTFDTYRGLVTRLMDVIATMEPKAAKNGSSLRFASASALYHSLLEQTIKRSGVDPGLLNKLLDARALVEKILRENTMKKMQEVLQMLTGKVEELTEMNGFLRVSGAIAGGSPSFLQDFLDVQAYNRQLAIEQHREITGLHLEGLFGLGIIKSMVMLRQEDKDILAVMTKSLSKKDRQKLRDFLCFSDSEKRELKKDLSNLLEVAVLREYRNDGNISIPFNDVLKEILAKIRKSHLVDKYFPITQEPVRKPPAVNTGVQTQVGDVASQC